MTTARHHLSDAGQLYVGSVAAVGTGVVLHSLYALSTTTIGYQWFVLAGLTLLSGSFTIRIPTIPARLSVSETFVFAGAILFGPAAATIIVVLDSLIISLWLRRASRQPLRVLFNMAAPAIAIWVASHVFFQVAAIDPLYLTPRPILSLVAPLLLMALLYFLLNSWLIAGAVGFEKHISPFVIWRDNFMWLSLNYFSGASVAALLLPYLQDEERAFIRVAGIILPLLLISYLTFKTALGRVEDANKHLSELNRLYLSTIETLAMAIDAKDQITHGHIRRVQQYAVGLAKRVGISDLDQIQAIEAASLLHDMGKLAVPEYILNKPGKLTPAEFEKMKLHASVGADILSAIDFPYPVVPIVRHHHESWDGTGYPDGLRGSDIPIGARILSVVDCFDALTSDRPYRPRLSDAEAIKILVQRRGSMYDPLVVDTFINVHLEIAPQAEHESQAQGLAAIGRDFRKTDSLEAGTGLDDITASTGEMLTLFSLARGLSSLSSLPDVGDVIAKHVKRLIPSSLTVFYVYDSDLDELVAAHACGENAAEVTGMRIGTGQRLSGWVAANRQSIRNSDPVLDFGESARGMNPRPRSCLSTPLLVGKNMIGVLTLYSTSRDAFTEEHQRVAEIVGRQVAPVIQQSAESQRSRVALVHDQLTGLPHLEQFRDLATIQVVEATEHRPVSLLLIDVDNLDKINRTRGRSAGDEVMGQVVRAARKSLRAADMLFRYGNDEFVALLLQTNKQIGRAIANRMADAVAVEQELLEPGHRFGVSVSIVSAPSDGTSVDELLSSALQKQPRPSKDTGRSGGNPLTSIH